jgi:hypothetical protein
MALTHKSPSRWWSRLHSLVLFTLLTGLLVGGVGAVLALFEGQLTLENLQQVYANVRAGQELPPLLWPLVGGAAAVVVTLLFEALVFLRLVAGRRSVVGLNAAVQVALAVLLLVGVNVFSFFHYVRLDWTSAAFGWAQRQPPKFTLPEDVRAQLGRLRGETKIVVYQRHKTFGTLSDKPDARDYAAERKVVEKVNDLVDQFREFGPQFRVVVLDVEEEGYEKKLDEVTKGAPQLRTAIDNATENSIFFYAGDPGKVQRLSFNEFYQLDKTASVQQGNLVLLFQGVKPFADKVLNIDERKPRVGIAVIHEVLTTEGEGDYGLAGLKKALTAHGFEVRDIVLKKWSRFAPPEAAAYSYDESKLDRIDGRLQILDLFIKALDRERQQLVQVRDEWKNSKPDELTKAYAKQLQGRRVSEEMRLRQVGYFEDNVAAHDKDLAYLRERRAAAEQEWGRMDVDALTEQRRMADLRAKMDRMLADCDVLLIPRMTLRNVTTDFDNIPYRLYRLDSTQVEAVKDFMKSGKPVLACIGPANEPSTEAPDPAASGPDGLDALLGQLGIKLGKQTVLFDVESESFADRRGGLQVVGADIQVPPVAFDWKPGAGQPLGREELDATRRNLLRESMRLASHSVGKSLDLSLRYPRPIYFDPEEQRARQAGEALAALACVPEPGVPPALDWAALLAAGKLPQARASGGTFMMTSRDSWNEAQPFPTDEREPRYEPPKPDDPTRGTPDEKRRGPFPIGVAVETPVPESWYDSPGASPKEVRVAVIGQGGFFTGNELKPARERLMLNTFNWLLGRDDRLPVADHPWSYPRVQLDAREKELWHWGTRVGLPVLFLYFGLVCRWLESYEDATMNLKTTLALLVFAAAAGVLAWFGTDVPQRLGVTPAATAPTADTLRILQDDLTDGKLQSIRVEQGEQTLDLQRGKDGTWSLPGGWPPRQAEVKQLVAVLTGLRSRFEPVAAPEGTDLRPYGLDHPAATVTVGAGDKEYQLAFGEPPAPPESPDQDEPEDHSRFARPTYLQLAEKSGDKFDKKPEVVRLAPGLLVTLDRPVDYYQQRRLFPADRVAKEGAGQEKEEKLEARALAVKDKNGGHYTLQRAGDEWELSAPERDRVDPDKLKTILTAVPDIWAEQFVDKPKKDLAEYGLKDPEQTVQVTLPGGGTRTLLVGKTSRTKMRMVMRPSPPGVPVPPQPQPVHDEYRYAKLQDNAQIFEIKAERLKDVFVAADTVRDPQVARFRTGDANRLEIDRPGQPKLVLAKEKDNWKVEEPLKAEAENGKVTELLDKLSGLQAHDKDVIHEKGDGKKYGLDKPAATVKVTVAEEPPGAKKPAAGTAEADKEKDKKKVTRTITVALGKRDAATKKLYVQTVGYARVNAVEDAVLPLVERPALAYRGRRVLDFLAGDVDTVKVQRGGETVVLKQADGKWRLTEPVAAEADDGKASVLVGDLGRLEAVEYVRDAAKPDDLDKQYGLGKPALSITVHFRPDAKKPDQTLLLGKEREGKGEYFAKLAGSDSVFAVRKDIHDTLDQGSLAYRPLQLPPLQAQDITEVRVQKEGAEEYRLTHKDGAWKVAAPFDAAAVLMLVQPMADELANLRAERYEAHTSKDPGKYGLDKPHLRLTAVAGPSKERVLLVGKATDKDPGARFAKLADGDAVFVVGTKLLSAVDHGALDLLDRKLLTLDQGAIERLRSQNGDARLLLQRDKDGWRVTESPAPPFAADQGAVEGVLNAWSNLRAERFAAYGPKADLAKYGLDKPSATATATVKGAGEHTLELGKPVEGESGARYARLDRGPGVAVLSSTTANELTRSYLDYVNRTLLSFDPAAVNGLAARTGKETVEVAKRDDGWALVKPVDLPADEPTVQNLLGQLTGKAERVAAYPAKELKPFGLDEPAAVVTLRLAGAEGKKTELVLKVGKPVNESGEGGERFAQAQGSQAVVVLPAALANGLLAGRLGFRNRVVKTFVDADRAVLERGPRKAVFARVEGTWKLTEPLEAEADNAELDNLIQAVTRLRATEFRTEKPTDAQLKVYGLDKPEMHWRFLTGDKEELSLLVGRREKVGGRCYARLEKGDLVFVLDPAVTGKLFAEYRKRDAWKPSLDSAQADRLTYTHGGSSFTLEKADGAWRLEGKPDAKIKSEAVSDALAAIAGLKAERYVIDKGADLKLYGLEPPDLVIEVQTPSGRRVLHVGRPEGGSRRYYARVPGMERDVFVIAEADATRIVRDLPAFTGATKVEK